MAARHGAGDDGDVLIEALLNERDLPAAQVPADEALRSLQAEHAALRQAEHWPRSFWRARGGLILEAKVEDIGSGRDCGKFSAGAFACRSA